MAVEHPPGEVREFANYLNGLLARLDQDAGWCAVFWQRDPEGLRACLDGREVPPWDVVEALLQDLAEQYGPGTAAAEERVRPLHAAALLAYDTRPGGRDAIGDQLEVMLREQGYAAERLAELRRQLPYAATRQDADAIRLDLAWARDDHHRASARCAELRSRIAELDRLPAGGQAWQTWLPRPATEPRKRRRGSARFAGMAEEEDAPTVVPPDAMPVLPAPVPATVHTPCGARFAGAAGEPAERPKPQAKPVDAAARRETAGMVETLVRLRGEGRSGEAHVLLAEAAYWPAARFPLLATELERAGLSADWTTLLWEAGSLPAGHLVAAADALTAAGRDADAEQILRQGVGQPAGDIGRAVLGLAREGRHREVRALLDAYVRIRTPEEAARSAEPAPQTLVPLLLDAAQGVSAERHRSLVHALRVAGLLTY